MIYYNSVVHIRTILCDTPAPLVSQTILWYNFIENLIMAYVYHRVPKNMSGNVLYPINELKEKYPILFIARLEHHGHQPRVLEGSIPKMGCFWEDVLHLTAIPPSKIAEELQNYGYDLHLKYYEIDAGKLDPNKTVVYLNEPKETGTPTKVTDFIPFNPNKVEELAHVSEDPMNFYKKNFPTSDEFLLNYKAPYILYKGSLNVEGAKIIEV